MSSISDIAKTVAQSTDFQINKRKLQERIQTEQHFVYRGGLFKATPEIIAFAATWPDDKLYIEDTYNNPILVERTEFLNAAREKYSEVMNSWHIQVDELRRIRRL
jgi:hypothetical protein